MSVACDEGSFSFPEEWALALKLQFPRGVLPLQPIKRGLLLLMHYREPDGRYLVRYRYQW